jgi:hypothetical protein
MRQREELNKQLQDLHVYVALFSETHLKTRERFYISNDQFYQTDRHPDRKCGTADAVRRGVPHNHVHLPPHFPIEATGVCILSGKCEVLLASL